MFLKLALFVTFLQLLDQSKSHISNESGGQAECRDICAVADQSEYDPENKTCKCLLTKNIDDIDAGVIKKNAKLLGISKIKRDVESVIPQTTTAGPKTTTEKGKSSESATVLNSPITATTSLNEESSEFDLNPEGVVGQRAPIRRQSHRYVTPQRRDSRPISSQQQTLIIQQIQDHLNRLTHISDPRLRELEMEAIRTNLRQLSQTHLVPPPTQRSRIRNTDDRRRQRHRLSHSRIVGVAHVENSTITQENKTESEQKELSLGKKHHFEIITQDPRLIDE